MAASRVLRLNLVTLSFRPLFACPSKSFHTSNNLYRKTLRQRGIKTNWDNPSEYEEWRLKHGLSRTGPEYGPLMDLPDWSYSDGRPGTMNETQLMKHKESLEFARDVVKRSKEADFVKTYINERDSKEQLAGSNFKELFQEYSKVPFGEKRVSLVNRKRERRYRKVHPDYDFSEFK